MGGGGNIPLLNSTAVMDRTRHINYTARSKERAFDYSNITKNTVQFLKDISEKKHSRVEDIVDLQYHNPDYLQINKFGRIELSEQGIQSFRDQGVDYTPINESIKNQYIAFYSPEMRGNVIGSVVDGVFHNQRLTVAPQIGNIGAYQTGKSVTTGFVVDKTDDLYTNKAGFGFDTKSFKNTPEINTEVDAYKKQIENSITFERATTNIFTNASKDRIVSNGETLTSNILTGASIRAGSEKAKELLKQNEK